MNKKLLTLGVILLLAAGCSNQSSSSQTTQKSQTSQSTQYTMAQVQAANTPQKCWTVINNNVYDLTNWINQHPGGPDKIIQLCGTDGTSKFTTKHGGQAKPEQELASLQIGKLSGQ